MTDLSRLSDAELQALYAKPVSETSSGLSSVSDDDLKRMYQQSMASTPQAPQTNDDVIDKINAVGGGVATGLVNAASDVGGLITDPLPEGIKQPLRSAGRAVGNALRPAPDSIPGAAMAANPNTASVGQFVGEVAPYAIPATASIRAGVGLGALAGAASAEDGLLNRIEGGAFGGATAGLVGAAFEGAKVGIQALRSSGAVKKVSEFVNSKIDDYTSGLTGSPREVGAKAAASVYDITKQADDELFTSFRATQGNIAPEIRTVRRGAEDLLDEFADTMTPQQKQLLNSIDNTLTDATSLTDLHNARVAMRSGFKNFSPKEGPILSKRYGEFIDTVDFQLENSAKKLGVLEEFKNANTHYKTKLLPLINNDFDEVADALKYADKDSVAAGEVLDRFIDKNIKADSPNRTKAFLNLLDAKGRDAVEMRQLERMIKATEESTTPSLTFQKQLDKLGPTYNVLFSGENKQLVDATKKILDDARPLLKNTLQSGQIQNLPFQAGIGLINKLISNPAGRTTMKLLGEPSTPKKYVGEFIKQYGAQEAGYIGSDLVPDNFRDLTETVQPEQPQDISQGPAGVIGVRN